MKKVGWGHCRAKEKSRSQHKCLSCMVTFRYNEDWFAVINPIKPNIDLWISSSWTWTQKLYLFISQSFAWFCVRAPEVAGVTFSDSDSTPVSKFLNPVQNFWMRIRIRARIFFKFENPTPVHIQANVDANEIQQCLNLSKNIYKDHADSCHCRK